MFSEVGGEENFSYSLESFENSLKTFKLKLATFCESFFRKLTTFGENSKLSEEAF